MATVWRLERRNRQSWNHGDQRDDHLNMRCDDAREALSARLDGEVGRADALLDAHLRSCSACRDWLARLDVLHRMTRIRPAEPVPDLSPAILASVAPPSSGPEPAPAAQPVSWARWALFAVALTQLVLAIPALVLGSNDGASVHVARELGAFDVALAAGLLVAAWQPERARGLLPAMLVLAVVVSGSALADLVDGSTTSVGEAPHLLDLAGMALIWLVGREHHDGRPSRALRVA